MSADNFESLLKTALEKRARLFGDSRTDCFRLFNGDGDGTDGLTIDYYAGHILVQYFNDALLPRWIILLNLLPVQPLKTFPGCMRFS
jgi:23S rRNA G2069 N7-methylase RlmK/C1962 C5-methylase RlmI